MSLIFSPGTSSDPYSDVELTLSCRQLRDMDIFSKSDPMVVVYLKNTTTESWQELKRTEVIYNNLNPDFATKIDVEYHFEEAQILKFEVYDIDTKNLANLAEQDFLGFCITTLGQIVSNKKVKLNLCQGKHQESCGELHITAEELSKCRDEVTLRFSARDLRRQKWCAWLDPFLEIYKIDEDCHSNLVFRSEVLKRTSRPCWKVFTLPTRTLCGNDMDRGIKVACLDYSRIGRPRLIGEFHVTLRQLSLGPGPENEHLCVHPKKQTGGPCRSSGTFELMEYSLQKVHSFLDFVMGGLQIHCTVAIDFTASNGNPNFPESLHYINPIAPNPYEQALSAVVEIIQDYDSDKLFPVLGFGARLPPHGHVSHEFYVNFHPENPFCAGVEGVVDAYKNCIQRIQLFGPTNFSPVINHVARYARTYQDGTQYFILLIITDGIITDMPQTKQAIISASTLPMSIIIVGVGNADFSAMSELDADAVPLSYNGRVASRDIVQFVAFREFQKVQNVNAAKLYLAKEVLAEIPDQVVGFMKSRNISPSARKADFDPVLVSPSQPPPYSET